ncbi:TetR/AcrR family transcriptional regulator [Actinoplanes sp. TRM 88003]|uniref:TetR/AcrR family transcriptional regulator n=1 Tax=Paractinoplanes aksuensis TaxID=2939490 RepID=A0ABT1DTV0_9ACTN|nr:TetR/AcrR family transcriptional regulator [Actinoplanes aksuensis]MCO8274279.1 TetR/AcrR family transcriptional regulator [Actinoplanes aksuensis]
MTSGLSPRREPRQVRAELTRERILTAAAHVFTEHGYAAGTTNRIAERARISIGSLYQYYPNKDAILAQLLIRHIDRGAGPVNADFSPGSLRALVRALVRDAITNHDDDPQLLRIMIEQAPLSTELLETITRHERTRVAQVRDLLAQHPDVAVRDLDTAAELITFTVEMNTHKLLAYPRAVSVEALESELVDMVTRYLRGAQ